MVVIADEHLARAEVEQWLTETVRRSIYRGEEVVRRLRHISSLLPRDDLPHQNFVTAWLLTMDEGYTYRALEIQDQLLSLWAHFPK